MISIDRLKEMALEDIKENPEKHLEEYTELLQQLDQLKAENDELMKQHQADKGLITSTGKQNYQLLQEYDKLKEEKQGLIKDWEEKKNLAYEIACKNEKLKQTLTEIKEIAEVLITTTDEYDTCFYKDRCDKCEVIDDCQYNKVEQILQKISEVEDANV